MHIFLFFSFFLSLFIWAPFSCLFFSSLIIIAHILTFLNVLFYQLWMCSFCRRRGTQPAVAALTELGLMVPSSLVSGRRRSTIVSMQDQVSGSEVSHIIMRPKNALIRYIQINACLALFSSSSSSLYYSSSFLLPFILIAFICISLHHLVSLWSNLLFPFYIYEYHTLSLFSFSLWFIIVITVLFAYNAKIIFFSLFLSFLLCVNIQRKNVLYFYSILSLFLIN